MSVIIEFHQIEKKNILSENKIFGMYELPYEGISYKNSLPFEPNYFQYLFEDANKWDEVYFRPFVNDFLFYLLAVGFETEVGFKEIDGESIIVAFDPKVILNFLDTAIKHSKYGREGIFDHLKKLVEDAIKNDWLIFGLYG